jgi:hypothetical protein
LRTPGGRARGVWLAAALTLAAVPAATAAQDLRSPDTRDAAQASTRVRPAQDLRSPDTRDVATGGGVTQRPIPAPRIVQVTPGGFDWGDAGVGAGGTLGLVLIVTGTGATLIRRRPGQQRVEIAS